VKIGGEYGEGEVIFPTKWGKANGIVGKIQCCFRLMKLFFRQKLGLSIVLSEKLRIIWCMRIDFSDKTTVVG
jgi:hypothetical protein